MSNLKTVTRPENGYIEAFSSLEGTFLHTSDWLRTMRGQAMSVFADAGFPTRRSEEWRYTNLKALTGSVFLPANDAPDSGVSLPPEMLLADSPARLVFVNGRFSPALSNVSGLPEGLTVQPLGQMAEADLPGNIFAADKTRAIKALNTAFLMDGVMIRVAANTKIERPVELCHITRGDIAGDQAVAAHMHHVIVAEEGSEATFFETYTGDGSSYWTNMVTNVQVAADATLNFYKIEDEGRSAVHLAETDVVLADRARYTHFALLVGGQTARHDIRVRFEGGDALCSLNGAYLGADNQSLEVSTFIDHATPDNNSDQNFKGVLDKGAHTAFQGKVLVRQDAQHTNADQSNQNLVLHRSADANTKPELEIYADDVKCSHGATVGELDETALFYLESRGLPRPQARAMLIEAFVAGLIDDIPQTDIRDIIRTRINGWMTEAGSVKAIAGADK